MHVSVDARPLLNELRVQVRQLGYVRWDEEAMRVLRDFSRGPAAAGQVLLSYLDWFIELQRSLRGQDVLAPLRDGPIELDGLEGVALERPDGAPATAATLPDRRGLVRMLEELRAGIDDALNQRVSP
jgi:hypothetical protein